MFKSPFECSRAWLRNDERILAANDALALAHANYGPDSYWARAHEAKLAKLLALDEDFEVEHRHLLHMEYRQSPTYKAIESIKDAGQRIQALIDQHNAG